MDPSDFRGQGGSTQRSRGREGSVEGATDLVVEPPLGMTQNDYRSSYWLLIWWLSHLYLGMTIDLVGANIILKQPCLVGKLFQQQM